MKKINVAEARAGFSRYLAQVEAGETITLCRRNVPIAEIRPLRGVLGAQRPIGIDRGMVVPPSFFEPLPDELLDSFEGVPHPDDGGSASGGHRGGSGPRGTKQGAGGE